MPKRVDSKRINLMGETFGDLQVVKLSDRRDEKHHNTLLWECRCQCGRTIYVLGTSLIHGHYKGCGCKRIEKRNRGVKKHIERDRVDGTRKSALKAKLSSRNKSGHKGVIWVESRKKWRAVIGFQGKQKFIGNFDTLKEAIEARLAAEEIYHKPLIDKE